MKAIIRLEAATPFRFEGKSSVIGEFPDMAVITQGELANAVAIAHLKEPVEWDWDRFCRNLWDELAKDPATAYAEEVRR
jgi:hypothetical protein